MSEETTASALGQIAFAEYYGRQAGAALVMPDSWAMQSDAGRADWEAAAVAVAAEVTSPTAEDYDHATDIVKLTDLLDKSTAAHWNVGLPGEQKIANAHRREAGLEELT